MDAPTHPEKRKSLLALLEIGILFFPAIPAYLWMWPKLTSAQNDIVQAVVYVYILAGTLLISRGRYNWDQLGLNRKGLGLTLGCGLAILVARLVILLSIHWALPSPQLTWLNVLGTALDYLFLVGVTEELLFRGLIYRLFENWLGLKWAIFGSSIGFMLWHIFGQGPLSGVATLLIGLLFALIRWRAGGLVGLIVLHALWDFETAMAVNASNAELLNRSNISLTNPFLAWLGAVLLFSVPVYLIWIHPKVELAFRRKVS